MLNKKYIDYPNPNFIRESTQLFNDNWEFSFDKIKWHKINLPFAPQSKLSGIQYTDFIPKCFYRKIFLYSPQDKNVIIHFGAVDYATKFFINGKFVGEHIGGFTPFSFDITKYLEDGENYFELSVEDEFKNIPKGKQSFKKQSFGCFYTRTTGIWQPVWLEYVNTNRILDIKFYPDIDKNQVVVKVNVLGSGNFNIKIFFENKEIASKVFTATGSTFVEIPINEMHLWDVGKGNLYDVEMNFCGDVVYSYFGLRSVRYDGFDFLLNNKKCFQKFVLCQGFYKDGIYTPTNIDVMEQDIIDALLLGFNGIRPHQKLFDPRFLYLCDRMGVLLWGEFPSWGIDYTNTDSLNTFLAQWEAALSRDFNHPSIILWCPLNEVWYDLFDNRPRDVKYIEAIYDFTKNYDTTRPCVDVSGGHHCDRTDLYDFHCYESAEHLDLYLTRLENEGVLDIPLLYCKEDNLRYIDGVALNLSEFGGFSLGLPKNENVETVNEGAVQSETSWGYGEGSMDGDSFVEKYVKLIEVIKKCKKLSGFCYTQLYDIEQEQNGFYTYERIAKLTDMQRDRIKEANNRI